MTRKIGILLVMLSLITLAIILVPSCIPRPHRYKYFVPVAAIDLGVSDYVDLMAVGPQEWTIADLRATINGYEATIRNYTVPNEPIRPGDHVRLNVDDAFRADDRVHVEILHVPTGDILLNTIVKNVAPWAPPPPLPVEDPAPPAARGYIAGFVTDTAGVPIMPIVSPTHPLRDSEIRGVSMAERANVSARKQDRGIGWATITDKAGYFKMEVDVAVYDMRVWALGFSRQEVSGIVVTEGETVTVNFTLERAPAGYIAGLVTDVHGTPIEGAFVDASCLVIGRTIGYAFTDPTGHFNIRIQVGTYQMIASAPPRVQADFASDVVVLRDEITTVSFQLAHDR